MHGLVYDHQSAIRVEGPKPTLTRFKGTVHEMDRYILNSAEKLVQQGYHWEDMACIYRTHQTMNRMITQFSGKSIPHNILGDTQRDRNSNARCITALLALILNPSDANAFSIAAAADSASRPRRLNHTIAEQVRKEAKADRTNLVEAAEKHIDRLSLGSSNHRNLHYVVNAWRELNPMMDTSGIELYDICRRANTLLLDAPPAGKRGNRGTPDLPAAEPEPDHAPDGTGESEATHRPVPGTHGLRHAAGPPSDGERRTPSPTTRG